MNNKERLVRLGTVFTFAGASFLTGCGVNTKPSEQEINNAVGTAIAKISTPVSETTGKDKLVLTGSATPESTKLPSGQRESAVDHEMKPGDTYTVNDGDMVKGDVLVDDKRYFDDLPQTGLIMEIHQDGTKITAPWGANVSKVGFDQATRNSIFGDAVEGMKAKGCENGCDQVNVIKYPGGQPQGK